MLSNIKWICIISSTQIEETSIIMICLTRRRAEVVNALISSASTYLSPCDSCCNSWEKLFQSEHLW